MFLFSRKKVIVSSIFVYKEREGAGRGFAPSFPCLVESTYLWRYDFKPVNK
jgi:hypothetical protein